jgi:hypothetical protein
MFSRNKNAAPAAPKRIVAVPPKAPATPAQAPLPAATPVTPAAPPTAEERAVKYRAQLSDAQELRATLLRDLSRGEAREEQLRGVESEINDLKQKLKWIDDARALEAKRNSKAARDARFTSTRDSLQAALNDARALGKEAEQFIAGLVEMGNALARMEERRRTIQARYSQAIVDAKLERASAVANTQQHEALDRALEAITLPSHVLRALLDAGFGNKGIKLPREFYDLRPFTGTSAEAGKEPPADVIVAAVEQLKTLGNTALIRLKQVAA